LSQSSGTNISEWWLGLQVLSWVLLWQAHVVL